MRPVISKNTCIPFHSISGQHAPINSRKYLTQVRNIHHNDIKSMHSSGHYQLIKTSNSIATRRVCELANMDTILTSKQMITQISIKTKLQLKSHQGFCTHKRNTQKLVQIYSHMCARGK